MHDNSGQNDEHLPLCKGCIDFGPVLKMIEERGITAALEQKTESGVHESLAALKNLNTSNSNNFDKC